MLDQTLTILYYAFSLIAAFFFGLVLAKLAIRLIIRMGEYLFIWTYPKFMAVLREPRLCLHCKAPIEGKEALPIFGYLLYKGKCSKCKQKRSFELLLFEIILVSLCVLTMALLHFQFVKVIFTCLIITLYMVCFYTDLKYTLLPDALTSALLWVALAASLQGFYANTRSAVEGAIMFYMLLTISSSLFLKIFKTKGICPGDCKYIAAIGACFGLKLTGVIIILSAITLTLKNLVKKIFKKANFFGNQQAFAPYLSAFAILMLFLYGHF